MLPRLKIVSEAIIFFDLVNASPRIEIEAGSELTRLSLISNELYHQLFAAGICITL